MKRTRGGTQPLPLSRDEVLRAALPLLARHGVDGLTVRAVADVLGISSPAVYHYVGGRDDLIDRLCEQVAAEVDLAAAPEASWDDAIVAVMLTMDRTFARYPGVASRVLAGPRRSPAADGITAAVRMSIERGGFTSPTAEELLAALQFLFGGWLLAQGRTPAVTGRTHDVASLESAVRALLRGFGA